MYKHGHTPRGTPVPPEYSAWACMKDRCYNPGVWSYKYYGGRGIKVCNRWRNSFVAFLADMGNRPSPKHSLDRINNDLDYSPENCRWATKQTQMANRSNAWLLEVGGVKLCAAEWGRRNGLNGSTITRRLKRGWPAERAITEPAHEGGGNHWQKHSQIEERTIPF